MDYDYDEKPDIYILESIGNGEVSDLDISDEEKDPEREIFRRRRRNFFSDSSDSQSDDEMDNSIDNTDIATKNRTLPEGITWTKLPFPNVNIGLDDTDVPEPPVTSLGHPIDYFMQYFDKDLFETITLNTNLYCEQTNITDFIPTNKEEIKKLIGIHLLMDWMKNPDWNMFWDNDWCRVPIISNAMPLDRFTQLRNNLHIINNACIPKNNQDKFIKVRPLYNQIKKKCNELPKSRYLAIGEQIVPYKEQLKVKNYKSDKIGPWRVKIFVLVDNFGMVYDFILYQSSSTELNQNNIKQFGFGASIVLHLVENLKKNTHVLAFDDILSTYQLFVHLYSLGIYANGIINPNYFGNPPLLSDKEIKKLDRGATFEVSSKVNDQCTIGLVKYKHYEILKLGSNFTTLGSVELEKKFDMKLSKYVTAGMPSILKFYNSCVIGLDKYNKLMNDYTTVFKSKKWTLQLIINAFNLATSNAWLQYKKEAEGLSTPKRKILDYAEFRLQVSTELIGDADSPIPADNVRYDQMDHWPGWDSLKTGVKCKNPQCSSNKRIHSVCKKCNIHLCLTAQKNCFLQFHTDDSDKEN